MRRPKPKQLRAFPHGLTLAYIGDGKGKTTAAVGAATRARGYGHNVLFFQFFKSAKWPSGERAALQRLGVDVRVRGEGFVGILGDSLPKKTHVLAAQKALLEAKNLIASGRYFLVVCDELISCVEVGLLTVNDIASMLRSVRRSARSKKSHIILTGHKKYPTILALCDVVTLMSSIKHPYYKGFLAVKGIDF